MAGEDERLEIVFWWLDGEDRSSIEDEPDPDLDRKPPRRRRLPWPGRRDRTPA